MGHIKIRNNVITVRERWILGIKYIPFCSKAEYYTWLPLEFPGKGRALLPEQRMWIKYSLTLHPMSPSLPGDPGQHRELLIIHPKLNGRDSVTAFHSVHVLCIVLDFLIKLGWIPNTSRRGTEGERREGEDQIVEYNTCND